MPLKISSLMSAVTGHNVVVDGIVDGQLQTSIIKMQRCTLNGCGKVCYRLVNCGCVDFEEGAPAVQVFKTDSTNVER